VVGFPRTREGAALAAGSYQQAFADRAILKPGGGRGSCSSTLSERVDRQPSPIFAQGIEALLIALVSPNAGGTRYSPAPGSGAVHSSTDRFRVGQASVDHG
jgi:hypothetical protein